MPDHMAHNYRIAALNFAKSLDKYFDSLNLSNHQEIAASMIYSWDDFEMIMNGVKSYAQFLNGQ